MPQPMRFVQSFGRKSVGVVGALILGTEIVAKPYELTALSVGAAALTVAVPAALGMMHIRMDNPAKFNVNERERLAETSAHVANVNIAMDQENSPLHHSTTNILLEQEASKPAYGSPKDRAYEAYIVGSFYNAYINSTPTAASLEGKSPEELAKIRKDRSFDAVGVAAHTLFSSAKHVAHNLTNPVLNKFEQSDRHQQNEHKMQAHLSEMQQRFVDTSPGPNITALVKQSVADTSSVEALETVKTKFNNFKQLYSQRKAEGVARDAKTETAPEPEITNKFSP